MPQLKVGVLEARNLPAKDRQSSDPYVLVKCLKLQHKTNPVMRNLNPAWNEHIMLNLPQIPKDSDTLCFYINTRNKDAPLGSVAISKLATLPQGKTLDLWLRLTGPGSNGSGEIHVQVTLVDFGVVQQSPPPFQQRMPYLPQEQQQSFYGQQQPYGGCPHPMQQPLYAPPPQQHPYTQQPIPQQQQGSFYGYPSTHVPVQQPPQNPYATAPPLHDSIYPPIVPQQLQSTWEATPPM